VQGTDSEDRMANITVSGVSGVEELDMNDILKDTSSIKVLEAAELRTEQTLPKTEQQSIDSSYGSVSSLMSHNRAPEVQNIDCSSYSALNTSSLNSVYKLQDNVLTKDGFVNIDSTAPYDSECSVVAKHFSTKSDIPSTVADSLISGSSVPLKVSSSSPNCVGGGDQVKARNNSAAVKGVHDKELNSFGDTSSSVGKIRWKLFENSGNSEENTKASNTSSSNRSAVYQDERNSAALGLFITTDVSVEPADGKLLVEENKVEVQEIEDGQEKSVAGTAVTKEESKGEMLEPTEIVGLPLKDESEPQISEAVQGTDSEDRMANITVSGVSGVEELDMNDILKDTSSIKALEAAEFQSSSALSNSTDARKNSDCTYPSQLNPFGDDDDTEQTNKESVVYKSSEGKLAQEMNPFGSTDDEAEMQIMVESPASLVPVSRDSMMKVLEAPKVILNRFWSDGEEPSSEDENAGSTCNKSEKLPVPRPRTLT
jgi:hypothetical protein